MKLFSITNAEIIIINPISNGFWNENGDPNIKRKAVILAIMCMIIAPIACFSITATAIFIVKNMNTEIKAGVASIPTPFADRCKNTENAPSNINIIQVLILNNACDPNPVLYLSLKSSRYGL